MRCGVYLVCVPVIYAMLLQGVVHIVLYECCIFSVGYRWCYIHIGYVVLCTYCTVCMMDMHVVCI